MAEENTFPFHFLNAFFVCFDFQRSPEKLPGGNFVINYELKIVTVSYPKVPVNIRVKSDNEPSLKFNMELIGLFVYEGTDAETDRNLIVPFLNSRGLFILWPYIIQATKLITIQMGIVSMNVNMPKEFHVEPNILKSESETEQ